MHLRAYGRSGLDVSPIAYGAMTIAQDPGLKDKVAPSLLAALERGVNLIDTARLYPGSEEIVAATLEAWGGRKAPLVSTKIAPLDTGAWRHYVPMEKTFPRAQILASVEASLKALGRERIDIVHLHQWYHGWSRVDGWNRALEDLRSAGKVRLVAVSAQDHEHDGLLGVLATGALDGVQLIYNLFESRPRVSALPEAARMGVGVIARCVLDSGGLSGTLGPEDFARRLFLRHAPVADYLARLAALEARFVPVHAASIPELAIRFVLSEGAVSAATIGMRTGAEVDAAIAAAEKGPLPAEIVEEIARHHVWTKNFYERLV
ncbi:MAG: aldo/keto reductase [Alphaproteobacteria bacterium]|nr:aldo/keto reductase [Alphaproteobacteria bacterium]